MADEQLPEGWESTRTREGAAAPTRARWSRRGRPRQPWQSSTPDDEGNIYYFNRQTEEVQWERPVGIPGEAMSEADSSLSGAAPSAVSTAASRTDPRACRAPRGRRRREATATAAPVCGCECATLSARHLGPRNEHIVRCRCPYCGHRPSDRGQGCHRRTAMEHAHGELWICRHCAGYCLGIILRAERSLNDR